MHNIAHLITKYAASTSSRAVFRKDSHMTSSLNAATPSHLQPSGTLRPESKSESEPTGLPAPDTKISSHPIEFSASGSEYFRIWIVNLLLIVVTLGLYLPWARVRKLKYFYGNTRVDGDALDFHGDPKKMLRGMLLVGVFFALYSQSGTLRH
jgi:Bacterial protein of unknown function (DUF898)